MDKHTKGKWYTSTSCAEGFVVSDSGVVIAGHSSDTAGKMDAEKWANARLIAAAPDMLDALSVTLAHLLKFWRSGLPGSHNTDVSLGIEAIRAAIAKATKEK